MNVLTRASEASLNVSTAQVGSLRGDVLRVGGKLTLLEARIDALPAGQGDQLEFISDFRGQALRLQIEAALSRPGDDFRVALYQLPRSVGGFLELVQQIVEETVAGAEGTAFFGFARQELAAGRLDFAERRFKEAYDHFHRAYRFAVTSAAIQPLGRRP